jgi:RHS repeat-associated protein
MKKLLLAIFIGITTFSQAQEPTIPIPPPGTQPLDIPEPENKNLITKQTPEQALEQKNASIAQLTALAPGGLNSGQNPEASPESNFINRFQDIPVNLYTGTPIINFPIYTLSEPGGASVPIGLSFNSSGMKAHDVASWVGMNWTFYAGGQITRIVRGIPDEGKFTLDNGYNKTGRKGFFQYGLRADNNDENDSQADMYFLNINDQSYKFTFDVNRKAHFFPEADIDVSVSWQQIGSEVVGNFVNWVITMPDGTKYIFDGASFEASFEIEAETAKNINYANFDKYEESERIKSTFFLTKIITAFGHETNFEYHTSAYSSFKLAEQSTTTSNCTFNTISKKINRTYINTAVLYKVSNRNIIVEFNKGGWEIGYSEFGDEAWQINDTYPARFDIDDYGITIKNKSVSRALHKISVYDVANPAYTLEWNFKYDHQTSTGSTIPFGYTTATVGNTHNKRFKLKSITEPDGNNYFFKYYDEGFNLPSRFIQGVDHWGYLNGANGATTMIGQDAFMVCANGQFANRTATAGWSQYGTLTNIIHSTGGSTTLEYENHDARNYPSIIGGSRLKKTIFIDSISNIRNIKSYSYLQDNGQSSGFLTLKPVYHFDDNNDGAINQYWVSGLYQQLLSESGRPAVGYSNVKESIVDESTNLLGYTISDFIQPLIAPNIQQKIPYNCVTTFPPNSPPVTVCDTLVKMRPYKWNPYHNNTIGSPSRVAVYNGDNQILSDKSIEYGEGPYGNYTDQAAYRSFRMEGKNYNFISYYSDASRAFRQKHETTKIFSLNGTKPIETTVQYIYKDEMDNAYKEAYPGTHNQLVKTITTNSLGHQIENKTKYAADFDFGQDESLVCTTYDPASGDCLSYTTIYTPRVPTDTEAKGIYQLKQKHIINGVVETITKQNGNIIGASYQTYDDNTALLKESYGLENLPRNVITEVNFTNNTWNKDIDYDLKSTVNSYNPIGLPIEIKERFGTTSKIDYDATNTLPIKTYKNFGAVDQQSTHTEYSKKIFGISKEIGTNGLEVRKEFYANGKLKQILDKDNKVLKHFTYLYRGTSDAVFLTDQNKNRIITRVPRIATKDATALSYTDCNISIQYLDGAGRTLENVAYKASPNGKSIISGATGYDTFGRAIRSYLPIESNFDDGKFMDTTAVHTKAKIFYGDNICYSEVIYENSPLSRPLKIYGVGAAFRTANKFSESNYETIDTEAGLKKITATVGENKGVIGSYASNQLFKKTSFDERGSAVIEYSDKSGNVIRRDVQSSDTEYLTTAYVYDDANRLRYVLPPNAYNAVKNQTEFTESDPVFDEMIYAYHYDGRGRVYETHTPGTGWSRVVYNRLNQPVLTQDDDEASTNTWNYAQTDGQGRTVRTGQIQTAASRATLQGYFNDYVVDNQFEERSTAGGSLVQYTNRSFPTELQSLITAQSLKTVAYYDNYNWRNGIDGNTGIAANYDFQTNNLNASAYSRDNSAVGLNTGGLIKDDLNGDLLMPAVSYYDDKNRNIQSIAFTHLQARDQSDTKYNFNGEIANSKAIYRQSGNADITRTTSHTYDHMSRPKVLLYGLNLYNAGAEFPMNLFSYDPIGRMKTKYIQPSTTQITSTNKTGEWGIGNTWNEGTVPNLQTLTVINTGHTVNIPENANYEAASLMTNGILSMGTGSVLTLGSMATVNRVALQTIDYTYNIRNQLRGINLDASGNMQTNPEKLFSYKLDYHEDGRYYDGNISRKSWKSQRSQDTRAYTYTYDRSNRVNDASFAGTGNEAYGVSNITYDIMGNLQTMNRIGKTGANSWGEIDKLAYSYINNGSKLQKVDDTGANALAGGFKDGNGGTDYAYTQAGKITSDLNKGISLIEYNYLDLVKKQTFTDGRIVEYGYTTTGQRRMRKVTKNGETNYTFYNGEIVYTSIENNIQNATVTEIQNTEGRFVGGQFTYGYTDQVGNLRLSYRDSVLSTGGLTSIVVQENAYDVWGNELDGLGFVRGQKDNFLISGKELDSESGNALLDWRDYDPTTGRMKNPDPAGQFISVTPYAYTANMPTMYTDPDGRWLQFAIGAVAGGISGWQIGKAKGAKGWGMLGYVLGGAGIGVATAGIGDKVLGSFSAVGTSGITLGQSALAYGTAGTASGAFSGGAFAALGGSEVGSGVFNGALWGGLGGMASGAIQHLSFLNKLNNAPRLAQNDPVYFGGTLNEVVVKAPRLAQNNFSFFGSVLGYSSIGELGLSATQIGMSFNRSRLPIHSRIGTFASFSKTYTTVGKFAKGFGAGSNFGEGVGIYTNSIDYANGDLSLGRFSYRTTGSLASLSAGAYAGSTMGPYGAFVGAGVGGAFSIGETVYDGVNWWLKEMGRGMGSLQYNLSNSIPNIKFK